MADYSITGDTKLDTSGFTKGVSSMTVAAGNLISDLTKTAATKLAGLAKSSVSVGMNFDASMSQVAATMGTTVDQIDNLTKVAKEMGSSTKFTATQAADALNYLALAGYDADKAAEVLPSVLNLAAAGGMDLAYASDLVTDAMASLNIEANKQNVDDFGNKLAMAASKANANVSQLGEAILTVGGTAANLKGGTTELTTALGLLANVGIKGAEGGTHLRNIILSLQSPTDEAAKKMQKLGLQVYDAQGNMRGLNDILGDLNSAMNGMTQGQKDSIINQLFNKTDLAAVNGLLAAQGDQWTTLAAQIDAADGAMGQMAETQIDNLQGAMTIMSSAFEGLQLAIYDELEPSLTEAVKWGTDILTQLTSALSDGGPEAMLQAAGQIISDLAASVVEQLPGLMQTGVEIVAQLATGIVEATPQVLSVAAPVLSALVQALSEALPQLVDTGIQMISQLGEGLKSGLPDLLAQAMPIAADFASGLRENVGQLVDAGIEFILNLAQGIADGLPTLIEYLPGIVSDIAGIINDNAPKLLMAGVQLIVTLGKGLIDAIPTIIDNIPQIIQAIVDVWSAFNWLDLGAKAIKLLSNGITGMVGAISNAGKGILDGVVNAIKSLPDTLANLGKVAMYDLQGAITGAIGAAKVAALKIVSGIETSFNTLPAHLLSIGKNAIQGLINGIADMAGTVVKSITGVVSGTVSTAKGILGIHSPSKVFDEIGVQVCNGLAQGLGRGNKKVKNAAKTVIASVTDSATTLTDGVTKTVETLTERMANGATQQKQVITETSRQMVGGVLKDVKTITEVAADGTKTVKQTMETVRETAKTVTSTFETLADGVKTTTQTVTETLTDGTETQKQVVTEVYDDIVDGALVTIERVKTIAADGTVQVAEQIKKSSADTFDGLWKELQTEADTGILGTFDDLYTAVKNQDWLSIGKWVANTIYGGLTANQKKQVKSFALGIVTKLNEALGGARDQLVQGAIDLGGQIVNGLTGGFSEVWQQAQGLGSTLIEIFGGLKTPLSNAALAISQGMKGGLISAFPEILASLGSLIGSIGGAFVAMLDAIAAALFPTGFGTPQALLMIAAGVALAAVIAGIVASIGGSFSKKGSSGGGSSGGGSSGSGGMGSVDITTGTGSLEDAINANTKALEKTNSALADMIRQAGTLVLSDNMRLGSTVAASGTAQVVSAANSYHREGDTNITQNFYNGHDTAAAQQREARWEADKAKARKR